MKMSYREEQAQRQALDNLFEILREEYGFATIEGTICCGGCASAQLASEHEDGTPGVYYHEQDVEDGYDEVYLGFGVVNVDKDALVKLVGQKIRQVAGRVGLDVEWNGSPARRILVSRGGI